MIFLLVLICIIYPECEAIQLWKHPFPGFPPVLRKHGKSCIPEELKRESIPTVSVQDGEPVYLNLYDLSVRLNRTTDGIIVNIYGVYHSGIQVYGIEYSYEPNNGTGIEKLPAEMVKTRPGRFKFKQSILLGDTDLKEEEVERYVSTLEYTEFTGDKYNLITRNCNHFSDAFTTILIGKGIPRWVNRAAFLGKCVRVQRVIPKYWIGYQYYFN